jgi:hypothetical protein
MSKAKSRSSSSIFTQHQYGITYLIKAQMKKFPSTKEQKISFLDRNWRFFLDFSTCDNDDMIRGDRTQD